MMNKRNGIKLFVFPIALLKAMVRFKGGETGIVVINPGTARKDQTFTFSNDSIAHVK